MGILLEALAAPEGASFAVSEVWLGLCWGNGIAWDAAVLLNLPTDVLIPHPLEGGRREKRGRIISRVGN